MKWWLRYRGKNTAFISIKFGPNRTTPSNAAWLSSLFAIRYLSVCSTFSKRWPMVLLVDTRGCNWLLWFRVCFDFVTDSTASLLPMYIHHVTRRPSATKEGIKPRSSSQQNHDYICSLASGQDPRFPVGFVLPNRRHWNPLRGLREPFFLERLFCTVVVVFYTMLGHHPTCCSRWSFAPPMLCTRDTQKSTSRQSPLQTSPG